MSMCDVCCYAVFQDNYGHRQVCSECCSNIRDIANAYGQDEVARQVHEAAQKHLDIWLTTETVMDMLMAWFPDLFESSQIYCEDQGICDGSATATFQKVTDGQSYLQDASATNAAKIGPMHLLVTPAVVVGSRG